MKLLELVAPFRKAVIGAVATVVLVWLAKHGVKSDMTVSDAVQTVLAGAFNGVAVYATTNKEKK